MDALVTGTLLITMDPTVRGATGDLGIVGDGAVGRTDGEIASVGPVGGVDPEADWRAAGSMLVDDADGRLCGADPPALPPPVPDGTVVAARRSRVRPVARGRELRPQRGEQFLWVGAVDRLRDRT